MESPILKQIAKFLQDKKKYKRWLAVFVCLAVVVGFATTAALKMRGKAMTHDERVLNCKLQVHQHAETCYDQEKNIICGYADYVVHKHNDDCYDPHNGNLVCTLPEVEAHQHTDECYQEQQALACGLEESEGHQHTEECHAKEQGELTCQAEEHTHAEECQAEDGAFTCGKEEHTHADECYQWTETLTCGQEESEGHHHTEACNQVQKTLVCQRPEIEVHTHGDECYQRVLITPEGEEIVQDPKDNTGVAQEVLAGTANKEVPEGRIEVRRSCGKLQAEEHTHTQENGCIEIREVLDGSDLRPVEEEPAETPEASADGTDETPADGNENQEGNPENGQTPMDGTEEDPATVQTPFDGAEEKKAITKTFEGEGFIVTAEYTEDADLPDEAELKAELITAESDPERYAQRETEYREQLGDKDATMSALLKMGFYLNGEEIEPKAAVKINVQMLDENGLPEGMPMTIVHFAEKGNEVIKGSQVENGKTSFEMNSFSEAGFGYTARARQTVKINKTQVYKKNPAFQVTFHLTGEVELPEGVLIEVPEGADNTSDEEMGSDAETEDADNTEGKDLVEGDVESGESVEDGVEAEGEEGEDSTETEEGETAGTEDGSLTEEAAGGNTTDDEDTVGETKVDGVTEEGDDNSAGDEKESFLSRQLDFNIKALKESSDEYKAIQKQLIKESADEGKELLSIFAVSYSLAYENQKLDLDDCKIEAEVTPTAEFGRKVEISIVEAVAYLLDSKVSRLTENQKNITELEVTGLEYDGDISVTKQDTMYIDGETETQNVQVNVPTAQTVRYFAVKSGGQANPKFTVQYYARLDTIEWQEGSVHTQAPGTEIKGNTGGLLPQYKASITDNKLPIIDTSGRPGGNLPRNGILPNLRSVKVENGVVKSKKELKSVYASRKFEYHKAPTINYFNALIENPGYKLAEVWVYPGENKSDSINPGDWVVYKENPDPNNKKERNIENLHFTNRTLSANDSYVKIETGDVIRLVYDTEEKRPNNPAIFYDYDISVENSTLWETKEDDKRIQEEGINSKENYRMDGSARYSFGNRDWPISLGRDQQVKRSEDSNLAGSRLNMGNWYDGTNERLPEGSYGYAGCTFGLATRADGNNIVFNNLIDAPKIFGTSEAPTVSGKKVYQGKQDEKFSLDFIRKGDTYTLTGVRGTEAQNLHTFYHPGNHSHIMSNGFWPMDGTWGVDETHGNPSDENDSYEHNNYFGMYYEISFELDPEYIGPLEYMFFGDDDMWVFLDDNTLVCDIGGVHSSVGEYVDLWDHLHKHTDTCYDENNNLTCSQGSHKHIDECYEKDGDGNKVLKCTRNKHTLKFFYTERGASGSSCWMQFTIPSVSSMTPETTEDDFGHLEVDKKVFITAGGKDYLVKDIFENNLQQADYCNNKEFTFTIKLKNENAELQDDYAYLKYDRDGKPITSIDGSGILAWDTIANGETFTLKDGEYISIRYLPSGTHYTIKEETEGEESVEIQGIVYDSTQITVDQNDAIVGLQAEGEIRSKETSKVHYVNKYRTFELPKTGGEGTILYTMAGVVAILLGAGFMYRKKFREGRVGGSS